MIEVLPIEEEDKKLITREYRKLLKSLLPKMDKTDEKNVRQAYEIAVQAHSKQRRKSGEPYILHPIEVARICLEEIGLGPTAVIAALLHDTVEDTDVTLHDIHQNFGQKIALIVDGLTKLDSSMNNSGTASMQAENFKKVLRTLLMDVRVVLIKMADRLHNMRTLGAMPRHKQLKIAAETSFIYGPLAHRLGLYAFKTEFQDLCMKITEPTVYKEIARKLNETKRARNKYIQEFFEPLKKELDDMGIRYYMTGRPKSIHSIYNKIKTKKVAFEEIYDLFAVRIIIDAPPRKEKPLCWMVYSTVTDIYNPIPERLKDWITTPKSNGYESLHTTVIGPDGRYVEIQIRTERMNEIAEKGFAAHWKYKGVTPQPDVYDRWLDNVREIMDNPDKDAIEFVNDFKTNLFSEEVYVYTPKGDMKILPKGATALDFAFSIHTDIGYHCTAIKVNNKLVPMGYKLKNGDQVQVFTSKNQKPRENWLKMVVTGKARHKIRSSMKEERRKQGQIGKEALMRKLERLKVDFETSVELLVKYYGLNSPTDLYFAISTDALTIPNIFKNFETEEGKLVEIKEEEPAIEEPTEVKISTRRENKIKKLINTRLLIDGEPADHLQYSFATCCNPVQGDDIFAYLTATKGMKIHRTNCPNATNLMANYGYRIRKAEWATTTNVRFVADLIITGVDKPGVIQKLSNEISNELGYDIRSFSIKGYEGYYKGKISLFVMNTDQLHLAIKALKNLDSVSSVTRIE